MFLEIKGRPPVSLELGQLYLLGSQINSDGEKLNNFIELDDGVNKKNDIELDDGENVSSRHCVIETNHKEEVFVFDLFSLKGTLLNNKILNGMKKSVLKNGDVLKIGDKEIKYIHQGHEMSCDSSGFLEVHKNTSDIVASSPESTSQVQKRSDDHKFLMPSRTSTSFSNRQSDSFVIPETQYAKARNSSNCNVSIAESIPNQSDGKINFNFGNLDSFEDDDFCIPETQEFVPPGGISSSQRPSLHVDKLVSTLKEESSMLENDKTKSDGSQFRICTQDYNEGFGEEEMLDNGNSQIIPISKHAAVIPNKSEKSINQSGVIEIEKEMSGLMWSKSNSDRETTELRADCLTPDLFEFEVINDKEINENVDKYFKTQNSNLLDEVEDEEDLMPTQSVPFVLSKAVEEKLLNEIDKPCLNGEFEEVLNLSDKENRCPGIIEPATQIFEARSHTTASLSNNISSGVSGSHGDINSIQGSMVNPDEEDALLTQAFLRPKSSSGNSSGTSSKTNYFNSTLLDDQCTEKLPATFFAEVEKTPIKQTPSCSANVFKKPDKDLGISKKASLAFSTVSENDIDLLMCTPQLIKDNISLDKSDDLRKHILAVKNKHLFGEETEDEEDEQNNLVKLINVPKSSLDFDHLLPHLNRNLEPDEEEQGVQKEAHKIYKFNISFGKEQDKKQSSSSTSKPTSYSRDERHAARDREREISERKRRTKATEDNSKASTKRQEKILEKEMENKEKKNEKDVVDKKRAVKNKQSDTKEKNSKQDLKTKQTHHKQNKKTEDQISAISNSKEEISNKPESSVRLRKRKMNDKSHKPEPELVNNQQPTSARRVTRLKSKLEEVSTSTNTEDDMDSISTQPIAKTTRAHSKSKRNDSQDSMTSNTTTKSNESRTYGTPNPQSAERKTERKRKAEPPTPVMSAKIELKRLRSVDSVSSLSSIAVSTTNVDYELVKDLLKNSKGLWNIVTNPADCDILVMDKPLRTFKFLLAMARGIPIVTSEYLKKLNKSKAVKDVSLRDYHFSDPVFEKKHKFSMLKSLQAAKKQKLFKDYEFLMTAGILPIPQEIKDIIEISGGCVHKKTPPEPKENQKMYLVTAKDDKKEWHKYRRLNKNIIIVSTEAIMSAIMTQSTERMKNFILA